MSPDGWPECAPRRVGMREAQVERAVELMRAHGGTAHLVVLRDGQVVLDRQNRCTPRSLFLPHGQPPGIRARRQRQCR